MQPKPNDVLTLSLVIRDFFTTKKKDAALQIGGEHRIIEEAIARDLLERGLINLDVLNHHRKMSRLRTTKKDSPNAS